MNNRKTAGKIISRMAAQSIRTSSMRNGFVMITIALASALLAGILSFAAGQREQTQRELAHRQQVAYYQLTEEQAEALGRDPRLSYHIRVKTGVLTGMDGFDIMPSYVSEMADQIRVGRLVSGTLPEREDEVAVCAAMLRRMDVEPEVGSKVTLRFYDGKEESFTVSGILEGDETAKQFSVFFSPRAMRSGEANWRSSPMKYMPGCGTESECPPETAGSLCIRSAGKRG